jgi:hypothetical protein
MNSTENSSQDPDNDTKRRKGKIAITNTCSWMAAVLLLAILHVIVDNTGRFQSTLVMLMLPVLFGLSAVNDALILKALN